MFEQLIAWMQSAGYWGIAALMALENLFPPIPSELIMPLAGFIAAKGQLTIAGVLAAATVGSVGGTLPWFYAAKMLGCRRLRDFADKHGRWLTHKVIHKSAALVAPPTSRPIRALPASQARWS